MPHLLPFFLEAVYVAVFWLLKFRIMGSLSHLVALIFPILQPIVQTKFPQGLLILFLGKAPHYEEYQCLDPFTNRVYISLHLCFHANDFSFLHLLSRLMLDTTYLLLMWMTF